MFLNLPILPFQAHNSYSNRAATAPKECGEFGLGHAVDQGPSLHSSLPSAGMQEGIKPGAWMCMAALGNGAARRSSSPWLTSRIPCGMGWEVVVLSVGSALHHLLQGRLKPCQVPPLSESSAVNEGNPIQLGLVKFSPEVHNGVTNVFTGFKLPVQ